MTHSARLLFYWKKKKKTIACASLDMHLVGLKTHCLFKYINQQAGPERYSDLRNICLRISFGLTVYKKVYLRILTHTYCSEPEIFNMLSSFALYHKPYTEDTLFSPILHIRSRLRGAARMMLSTRRRSSAASDAEETTALFSL